MLLLKGFIYVGDSVNKNSLLAGLCLSVGIIGALIILYGLTLSQAHFFFVIGSSFLLVPAIYFKLTYFVALEIILMAGHGAVLLGMGPLTQLILPILLCLQLFIYYLLSGQLKNVFRWIGLCGIVLLSMAFSFEQAWFFIAGSSAVAIFSFYQIYRGRLIALLWAILNVLSVVVIALEILF